MLPTKRRHTLPLLIVLALATLAAGGAQPQEKVKFQSKVDAGSVSRATTRMALKSNFMGQTIEVNIVQSDKTTYTDVAATGDITMEREIESLEQTVNGQKMEAEEPKGKTTFVIRPDRTLVSLSEEDGDADGVKLAARLYVATTAVFPEGEVGVGDTWKREYQPDDKVGIQRATGTFDLVAFETRGELSVAKVRMTFAEAKSGGITAKSTHWIDRETGDTVYSDFDVSGIEFGSDMPGMTAAAVGTMERTSGGPISSQSAAGEAKKEKTIDDAVKDFEKIDGLFTIYRKREAARDTLYLEIPNSALGKLWMLQATASTGASNRMVPGNPIADIVFAIREVTPHRVAWIAPNYLFRADPSKPIAKAVERSFAESYLQFFKVEARQPDRESFLIDISDLFRGDDIAGISKLFSGPSMPIPGLGGGGSFNMDRANSFVSDLKAFPENLVFTGSYNFTGQGGPVSLLDMVQSDLPDGRSFSLRVIYNLFELPMEGYVPRLADGRVGYFTSDYQDFTKDAAMNQKVRNILRWRLEKEDPAAPVSRPKRPIVFWLDNAIPKEHRQAVRAGILTWNTAFERIGFKDAIEIRQMPDDADFDHADMRYNVIRWVASPDAGYAVALFRANPITGEILNAGITVDSNMVRYVRGEAERLVNPANYFEPAERPKHRPHPGKACEYDTMGVHKARMGYFAGSTLMPAGFDARAYLNEFIAHVVAHEMGHILGLRHNFVASTQLNLDQLGNPSLVKAKGTSSSVMDYVPFNVAAVKRQGVSFYSDQLGDYDRWAIEYGYRTFGEITAEEALPKLRAIASRTNQPGLAYQSDETADAFDPKVSRFDLSAEPLDYSDRILRMSRYLIFNLDKHSPRNGETYWEFTRDFNMLLGMYSRSAAMASRYVGALHLNANHKGDPGEQPTISPAAMADQKRALDLLNTFIFAENAFEFPRHYYGRFTSNPDASFMESFMSGPQDFPMLDRFAAIQRSAIRSLFRADVLRRVANNEYKTAGTPHRLTLPDLFSSVASNVWSELGTGKEIGTLRRQLQRAHLDQMIGMILEPGGIPDDARMLAWSELRNLEQRIARSEGRAKDAYTPIHLSESRMRIRRALEAQQTLGGRPAPSLGLLEMLLGGQKPPSP
jgi:hypothetical protein